MIYFTSDTHFNHINSLTIGKGRPFKNVDEMNEQLIKNWNRVVKPYDEIYHLGDFGWQLSPTQLKEIMEQLNGRKHLIVGNHDKEKMHAHSGCWESVSKYKEIKIDKTKVILFHYPIADFNGMYYNAVHLYGHVHANKSIMDNMDKSKYLAYNVGCDVNNYTPISWNEIKKILDIENKEEYYNRKIIITE